MICEKCRFVVYRDPQTYCKANGREIRIPSVYELGTWGLEEAKTCTFFQPSIPEISQSQFASDNYCIEEDLAESYAREKRLEEINREMYEMLEGIMEEHRALQDERSCCLHRRKADEIEALLKKARGEHNLPRCPLGKPQPQEFEV